MDKKKNHEKAMKEEDNNSSESIEASLAVLSPEDKLKERKSFIVNATFIVMIILIILAFFKYLVPLLVPFIIGFILALAFKPAIRLITSKTKITKNVASIGVMVLGYGIIVLLLILIGSRVVVAVAGLFSSLPEIYNDSIKPFILKLNTSSNNLLERISPELVDGSNTLFDDLLSNLQTYLISLSSKAISWLGAITAKIPSFLITFLFSIMSSVIITMNYEKVRGFLARQIPKKYKRVVNRVKDHSIVALLKYFRAYLIIMFITFVELSIGLTILSVNNAIIIAFGIAIFDILPIFGTGGIVIPWGVMSIINGNYNLGFGLLIIYVIITVIRNIIEPRIVGGQLGLNPLVSLICIFIGFKTIGILGMIFFPIIAQIIITLHDEEYITIWQK